MHASKDQKSLRRYRCYLSWRVVVALFDAPVFPPEIPVCKQSFHTTTSYDNATQSDRSPDADVR
jgi:hypothetical protein